MMEPEDGGYSDPEQDGRTGPSRSQATEASGAGESAGHKCHVQLSDAIRVFFDEKLSDHADIYGGIQLHGHFGSLPIVVKLVDENERNKGEARILSKLSHHSNVISLIETGLYDNGIETSIYIAMDKCHKENLREFVEKPNEIPLDQKHAILKQIITGIEYIHGKNIAHLDLKPGNILFTLDQKVIKIADFGLSEEIPKKKLHVKHQFGTNGFRPPESFGNSYISLKTDIFSLGVVFYFVLSNGKNPFGEDSDGQNVNMKNGKIDLSCLLVPNCETTKHLINCMLELKRNNRPTISEVFEHPCWTGNEVVCNFGYETCESSDSDSCSDDEEEPSYHPGDWSTLRALMKIYSTKPKDPEQDGGTRPSRSQAREARGAGESAGHKCPVQLSDAVRVFFDEKLSDHADIYGGIQLHGHFASLPIVVKLVDENERNKREARILSKLSHHSNVISLIETGLYDNGIETYIYIAMDKCHKENLREFVEKPNEIPLDQKHAILKQIITGIEYIHGKNIAHLDLKPGNILFTLDQKVIKIAGFGLSEEIPKKKLLVKHQFGTNGFRPPESFGNSYISLKTDIFSLGVVFYFVLSDGKNPFGEDSDGQNVNVKNGKIDLSCLLVPNCETTKHLIKCMLELKRNNRPTISEVSEHPCWTGNEVACNFGYETCESSDSDSCNDEEEPSYHPSDMSTLLALMKIYSTKPNGLITTVPRSSREIRLPKILDIFSHSTSVGYSWCHVTLISLTKTVSYLHFYSS